VFGEASELAQFNEFLATGRHDRAMPLFDKLLRDDASARLLLESVLMSVANHNDPSLAIVHGVSTVESARELIALAPYPSCKSLLRFLTLYSFGLAKRRLTAEDVRIHAQKIEPSPVLETGYAQAVSQNQPDAAAAILGRIALDGGIRAAAHASLRITFGETGRLGHNVALAVSYIEAARALQLPRGLLPLANLAVQQCRMLATSNAIDVPPLPEDLPSPDPEALETALSEGEFDRVQSIVASLCASGRSLAALRPLLVAASADPGFLGHNLSLIHGAAVAVGELTPAESAAFLWKLYRTTDTKFTYPEFLRLRPASGVDRTAAMSGFQATLAHRTPPPEQTVRRVLEAGVQIEELAEVVVANWGNWRVGEKEHTIGYLNAAFQAARLLGRDEAMLPLVIAVSKLPF